MLGICTLSVLVLPETLLLAVLMYSSETMLWKENKISRIMAIQMDNIRGVLRIKRIIIIMSISQQAAHQALYRCILRGYIVPQMHG